MPQVAIDFNDYIPSKGTFYQILKIMEAEHCITGVDVVIRNNQSQIVITH